MVVIAFHGPPIDGLRSLSVKRATLSVVLAMLGYVFVGMGYGSLGLPALRRRRLAAYLRSLPAKYLPGGILQPLVQSGLTGQGSAFDTVLHAVLTLAAGGLVSTAALFLGPPWNYLGVLGLLLGSIIGSPWFLTFLGSRIPRFRSRTLDPRLIRRCRRWLIPGMAALGLSFSVLTPDVSSWVGLMGVYTLAWLAGFVIWFLPGGLGVREAALVMLVGSLIQGDAAVLAVVHRAVTIVAEMFLAVVWWIIPVGKED